MQNKPNLSLLEIGNMNFGFLGIQFGWGLQLANMSGAGANGVPLTVEYSFKIGAVMFLSCVLWTVCSTKEYPPEDLAALERKRQENPGLAGLFKEVWREVPAAVMAMSATMKQLAVVQIFTWLGLFCMWMFFCLTTAYYSISATSQIRL